MSARKHFTARLTKLLHRNLNSVQKQDDGSDVEFTSDLCDICQTIGFNKDSSEKPAYSLGYLGDLKQRSSCPFCKLVLDAMQDDRIIHPQPIAHYETHEIRVFRQGPKKLHIQPLPTYSKVLFDSEVKGFDKISVSDEIDFDMVKRWLHNCETEHTKCIPNQGPFNVDLSFFRCIDVTDMCIVPVSISSQYVALSYKWGDCKPFLLLKPNKDDLFAKGGIRRNWDSIPKTIQDSIEFVRKVDCRYIWIDQLCLIQDDDNDRGTGITAMDLVYEQAHFTIIAGSGTDADSGLPGVRANSRTSSHQITSEVMPGVNLVLRHTMEDILAKSEYHHRGWTFQEYYLSRRRVLFIDDTIYFKCHEKTWQELEDDLPVRPDPTAEQGQALSKPSGDVYHLLGQLLVKYTTRELKMPNDYVFAMAGVCRRLADYAQCDLLFGIPVAALDWFVLFYRGKDGLKRRDMFPSWAWSGWYGQIYYNYGSGNVPRWTAASTWIVWHRRELSGDVALLWDETEQRKSRAHEIFGSLFDTHSTEPATQLRGEPAYTSTVLQFWTVSAAFALRKIDQGNGERLMWSYGLYWTDTTYELLDRDNKIRGFMTLDDPASADLGYESAELILLALSPEKAQKSYAGANSDEQPVNSGGRYFWVLMVEWQDGVAQRKGIGKIDREALTSALQPGASWKEIILA
ncbi:heterokaryon incompatibility protein-domain-containing protein [Xylariaceae sp. FL1019]|nr:heterokaryon incompatibility protein-domain-containing protein [Xylariaceae sp. FL1019]